MNRVFKVVWSKAVGQWVVTSEFGVAAGGRTRRTVNRLTSGPLAALSLMTALALYGPSAMAAVNINNIGFETGTLSGWTYSKTGTQGSTSYGSTGVGASVVTGMTDFEADDGTHSWTVTPFGNNMASLQAGSGSDSFATGAAALGLSAASSSLVASTMAGSPTNASWLYQDLTLAAGDYFSMAWQYVSTDYEPYNDASLTSLVNLGDASVFATVNNQNAQYALLGATNKGTGSYSTGSYGATGWQVATYQVSTAGTYRLGFMSLNLQDTMLSPVLFIDQAPGLTFDNGVPFGPVAPNPGSGAPTTPTTPTTPPGPVVIDGPKGTDELGTADEASFEGGTLVVDKDTSVDQDFKIDDKPGTIDQNGHDSTFTGKIDDAGTGIPGSLIVKNSGNGGSVTLTNTNGYTGTTQVDKDATLALSGNGSIDTSKKVVIDGTLDVTQAGPEVNITSLGGKGEVALGSNTLSLTDANDEFEGTIGGQGAVAIKGGTQVLSGKNTYAGGTSVSNNAVLQVSSDENLGDAAGKLTLDGGTLHTTGDVVSDRDVVLAGNGTFNTDTNTTLTNSGDVSGNGGLIKNGEGGLALTGTVSHSGGTTVNEGELTLSGQNTYTGGTTLNGGVLNVSSDGNLGNAAGNLTFNGGELHTTGDVNSDRDVVLAGNGTFNTDTNTTLTNNGDVSGTGGLIKNGEGGLALTGTVSHSGGTTVNEGELTLSGQNTYTGGTTLNGGVLNVSSDGNLGDAAGGLTFNGGELHTTGDVVSDRDVTLAGNGTFNTDTNTTLTNSGDVSGSGGLIKNGEGGLVLTGTVSHSGGTTVNEGELTLSGQNTYTGGTTLNGGVLNVSSDGNLGDAAGGLTFNGGELHTTGDVVSDRDVTLAGNGTFNTDTNTTLTNSGDVSGTGGLIKNGEGGLALTGTVSHSGGTTVNEGELTLSGQNTYTGGTTLNGGVLNVSSDGNLGNAAGNLTFNGGELHTTGDVKSDRDVVLAGNGTFNTDTNTTLTNSGDVSGNGGLIKNGEGGLALTGTVSHSGGTTVNEGELTLSGQNTYTGGTTLNGGVLNVSSDGNLGDAAGGLTFNGGTLHTTGDVSSDRDVVLAGNGTFNTDTNTTLTNSGDVSGNGGLIKNGEGGLALTGTVSHSGGTTVNEGELTLSGQNTYTGGTTLNGGVLNVSSDGNLGDAAGGLTFNGGTLHTTGDVSSDRDVVLAGNGTFNTDTNTTLTNSGDVSGTGGLIKNGEGGLALTGTVSHSGGTTVNEGELTLSGQNTYTGGTTLNGGVLNVSSDGNLGDAAGGLTFNGGELHTTGDVVSDRDVTLAGNGTFNTDTNTTLTNSGDVSGTGGLIKNGEGGLALTGTVSHSGGTTVNEGELTLSGQNTYTGGTTLNGGVLNVSSDGNLGDAAGGLTFNGGVLHTTGDVKSDRDVVLAGNGTFNTDTNTTLTNSGDVSGNGGLIKNGEGGLALTGTVSHSGGTTVNEGELTLSGQNTYTGGTTLNGGVLNVSSDGNLGDAAGGLTFNGGELHTTGDVNSDRDVTLAGNGTFNTDTSTTLTNSGDVSGTGGLIKNGEGGLALTGTVSHSGGTTVNEGELTLSGQNTYTGGTTLNGGVLNVSSDGNLGDAAGGLTFNGGVLQTSSSMITGRSMVLDGVGALRSGEGSTLTVNGPISGGGTLVADGRGTLVLGAANSHAGGTVISGGTVVLAHAGGLGSGAVAINDATLRTTVDTRLSQPLLVMGEATLDVASGTTTQLTGLLDGSRSTGCFIKSGAGRLNMAGTAVLANGTCVNEGTLSANGVLLSNVQVERAGTVRGTGAIAGNMRVDGTLAPGNSPGTLAVTGTVTLTDAATLQIDIDGYGTGAGAGNYSRLLVSGAAGRFVANGTLQPLLRGISGNASNTFTPKVGDMFRIVSGEGGVTGTFDRLLQPTEGLAASTRFQVYYTTGFDIDLYVTPTAYSADLVGKVNGNGLATAAALDTLVDASDAGTATADQTDLLRTVWQQDAVTLPVLVTALTGENHAKLAALAQSNATALADDVTGRLGQGVLVDASSTRIEQLLWANIGYGDVSVDADASADRFDARQRRASAGIDVYRSSTVAWGAGLGRTTSELERSPLDNTLDSNAFFAYGAARAGAVVLDGMLSYSADRWESQRPDILSADGVLAGKASGTTRMASVGVSLPFTAAGLSWQPSLRGNWQKVERNAYREGGDSLAALDVARLQAEGSRATLGLSVGSLVDNPLAARATWQFGLQAGLNHGQVRQATVTTALAGQRVDLSAAEAGKAFGRAQLQGTVRLGASSYLYGGISTEQGSGVENNSVNAGIRIAL